MRIHYNLRTMCDSPGNVKLKGREEQSSKIILDSFIHPSIHPFLLPLSHKKEYDVLYLLIYCLLCSTLAQGRQKNRRSEIIVI